MTTRIEAITPDLNELESWLADFKTQPGAERIEHWLEAFRELRLMRVQLDERIEMAKRIYLRPRLNDKRYPADTVWVATELWELFDRPVGDRRKM